jgi:hypothetical protein
MEKRALSLQPIPYPPLSSTGEHSVAILVLPRFNFLRSSLRELFDWGDANMPNVPLHVSAHVSHRSMHWTPRSTSSRTRTLEEEIRVYIYTVVTAFIASVVEVFSRHHAERLQMATLRKLLSHDKSQWRTLTALRRSIRKDENTTRELLYRLKARASTKRKEVWTLEDD